MKKALITGITGQDGSYLAEFLLSKDYIVHGLIRRSSTFNTGRIDHIYVDPHVPDIRFHLHYGDLSDSSQLTNLIYNIKPDEIYHLFRYRTSGFGRRGARYRESTSGARREGRISGAYSSLRGTTGSGKDIDCEIDRSCPRARVRTHFAGGGPRRSRHSGTPPDLRGLHARPHHSGDATGRHEEPSLPSRRGRQAGRLLPGGSGERLVRGSRPRAERHVRGSLSWGTLRSVGSALRSNREFPSEHS